MENSKHSLGLEMVDPTIENIFLAYSSKALVCIFNGFWFKTNQLYQWIHTNWSSSYDISLCTKLFFIIYFQKQEDFQKVQEEGPWF